MPTQKLIPNVDRRLGAWIGVRERVGQAPRHDAPPTITLSRQFGCEGYPLAETLQALLGARTGATWTIFDKALIERVSEETQLSERLFGRIGEQPELLDALANLVHGWRTQGEAYELLARYIVRIAAEGNAIIVGRGGAIVAAGLSNCFHFRLEAPLEHRIESIRERLNLDHRRAAALVAEHERGRERFLERFLHCSLADPRHYHAVFNTSRSTVERIAHSILALIPETPAHSIGTRGDATPARDVGRG